MSDAKTKETTSIPFKFIVPAWRWTGSAEDHEKLRKLQEEHISPEQEQMNKLVGMAMFDAFLKPVIVPALVKTYLEKKACEREEQELKSKNEQKVRRRRIPRAKD